MKAKQRPLAVILAGLALVGSSYAARPAKKQLRDFTLTISAENETVHYGDIKVKVKMKNVSLHTIQAGRWVDDPGVCYQISVLRDGRPAPMTERYREILTPKKYDPNQVIRLNPYFAPIRPFRSKTFEIDLERYFDLSAPGNYRVTFTAGSNPGQPDNVDIKSNTVTITVLPIEAE